MLQVLCSSVRVKLLARAKLIFLREQPDDFFFCGEPWPMQKLATLLTQLTILQPSVSPHSSPVIQRPPPPPHVRSISSTSIEQACTCTSMAAHVHKAEKQPTRQATECTHKVSISPSVWLIATSYASIAREQYSTSSALSSDNNNMIAATE